MTFRIISAAVLLLTAFVFVTLTRDISWAQESDAPADNTAEAEAAEEDQPDVFAVPEGKDADTLQEFLTTLTRTPAAERTPAGFRAHFNKLVAAVDTVLEREVDDETALLAVRIKSGSLDILEQFGDRTASQRKGELITKLKQSQRPALATHGRVMDVEGKISGLDADDRAAVKAVIDQVNVLLQDKPLTIDHARVAYSALSAIEQTDDAKLVGSAAQTFAKALSASDDPTLKSLAATFEGTARRLTLKGNPIEITGTTLSGDRFTIDQWKGKVVLVDFWATWCGPCVAAMPELKELYTTHHENGFEIVGVSLDESREQLEEFLTAQEIPWPTLFDDAAGPNGQDHKLATYYGVSAIPTAFLVGRNGKVAAMDLHGESLHEAVVELLGAE